LLYRGKWVIGPFRAGWDFNGPRRRKFLFARDNLREIPVRLRDPATQARLVETVSSFAQWILQAPSRGDPNVFQLVCDRGGWNIPWELVIAAMEHPSESWRIAFSRRLKRTQEIAPSRLDHPLRVLILRGDARLGLFLLNLRQEIDTLLSAWEGLPASVRASIEKPIEADADGPTLAAVLRDHTPDIIWFVGHGRREPEPGLLFRNAQWVSPAFFFKQLPPDHPPLFVVLMACDTASGVEEPEPLEQPSFAREAFDAGVAVLLAMQAPIGDVSSKILARELFMELAAGSSPAVALARARMVLRRQDMSGRNAVDWAAPVVWSAVDDSKRWQWNHQFTDGAQHQLFGREIMQSLLVHPETAAAAPTEKELAAARLWIARRRTWVSGMFAEKESVALAHRILAAVQHLVPDLVLVVDLRGNTPEKALQEWAENVMADIRRKWPSESGGRLETCAATGQHYNRHPRRARLRRAELVLESIHQRRCRTAHNRVLRTAVRRQPRRRLGIRENRPHRNCGCRYARTAIGATSRAHARGAERAASPVGDAARHTGRRGRDECRRMGRCRQGPDRDRGWTDDGRLRRKRHLRAFVGKRD
jgi:hypothetical protein